METFIVAGASHYFTDKEYGAALRALFDFLRRHLTRS